ncbi:MAG: RNA polymerase sigma factor [Anaerolineae bacterium]
MTSCDATFSSCLRDEGSALTDAELIEAIGQHDEEAFDVLYRRYNVPLYNYILRLIHRPSVAEELLQEVFLAVWEGAGGFRGHAQVKTWLFRIAHHQSVSWLRRKREVLTADGELPDSPVSPGTESHVIATWQSSRVREALDKLSPEHRAVLELAFFHEMSYAEIAEVLDCPLGTVKSRMSYARRYLSGYLKAQGIEGTQP